MKNNENNHINEESIGMVMKRIRTERGWSQQKVCENWPGGKLSNGKILCAVDRTVYAKYESGKLTPSDERIKEFASIFGINFDELSQKTAIVIPDTSALLGNPMLLEMLMEDFKQIIIADVVQDELSRMKNASGELEQDKKNNKKKAAQIIGKINDYFEQEEYKEKFRKEDSKGLEIPGDERISENDKRLIELAKKIKKKTSRRVYIMHYDKDIPFFSDDTIININLKDYISQRKKMPAGYQTILDFDEDFDNITKYEKAFENLSKDALDTFLPNGMTLLISCINCNAQDRIEKRGGRIIPPQLIKEKMRFLIKYNVDLNKTDCNRYCHTPLEHCISLNPKERYPFELFVMLLEAGADYNKGSIDETKQSDLRISAKNEGNTPLMKACWEGKKQFVCELLKKPDLSINQQDCNGYTALIKCAVQRYNRKKAGRKYNYYEELYKLLMENGADTRIRDRNNRTAKDWWDMADQLEEGSDN